MYDSLYTHVYEGASNENLTYFLFPNLLSTKGVLINDSYPDVSLFHSLLRGEFPSRWLQEPQCSLVSLTQMLAWGNYNMLQEFISPVIDN